MTNPEITDIPFEKLTVVPQNIGLDELIEKLHGANVPINEYGQGTAKTIGHLLSEVNEGEAILTLDQKGRIYREVNVVWVDVICTLSNGDVYLLREDRQEFKDGRIKVRALSTSIGEKIKPFENTEDAVARALSEEIGVGDIASLYKIGFNERTFTPDTFPGIESTYKMHTFASMIPETAFVPEGYTEKQTDKTNYYVWDLVHKSTK